MKLPAFIPLLLLAACSPVQSGREGNALYGMAQFAAADSVYAGGMAHLAADSRYLALFLNNRALAHLALQDPQQAVELADSAFQMGQEPKSAARALYHGGIAAFLAQDREGALNRLRDALLLDPTLEPARFNWEVIARSQNLPPPPSENPGSSPDGDGDQQESDADAQPEEGQGEGTPQPGNAQPSQSSQGIPLEQAERLLEALSQQERSVLERALQQPAQPNRSRRDW